jgi:hypothetical protein
MLGQGTHTATGDGEERRPGEPSREALADACRAVRERLDAIGRALAALTAEIDRTLEHGSALPEPRSDRPSD